MKVSSISLTLALCGPALGNSFVGIGDIPGGLVGSYAYGVSTDGSTVVGYSDTATGPLGFSWTNGVRSTLGDLFGGSTYSAAVACSANGQIVAGWSENAAGLQSVRFVNFQPISIGDLPGSIVHGCATGVSFDGTTIVGWSESGQGRRAYTWTESAGMLPLEDLPGGTFYGYASAISPDANTVVGAVSGDRGIEAVAWRAGVIDDLGDFDGGLYQSGAQGCSFGGDWIVGYGTSGLGTEGAYWTPTGTMVNLGDLPGGQVRCYANAVNSSGTKIFGTGHMQAGNRAWVWTPEFGMQELTKVVSEDFQLLPTGWNLAEATACTPDGNTVVGNGINATGKTEAYRAQIAGSPTSVQVSVSGLNAAPGLAKATIRILNLSNSALFTRSIPLPADGLLKFWTPEIGGYDLEVRVGGSTRFKVRSASLGRDPMMGLIANLVMGDINGDDRIDLNDYLLLVEHFDQVPSSSGWLPECDLDFDQTVGLSDYLSLVANFGYGE